MKTTALDSPKKLIKAVASILKSNTKATILIDGKGDFETGLSIEMIESKSDKWLLSGWSVDAIGTEHSLGVGVAKDLFKNDIVEIDAGIYATRKMIKFFDTNCPTDIRVGVSGSIRF